MEIERKLGFEPIDGSQKSSDTTSKAKFPDRDRCVSSKVKGARPAKTFSLFTKNEILYSLNKPDDFILGIVEFTGDGSHRVYYMRRPFQREPDFGVTSVNYNFRELVAGAEEPA